MPVSHELDYALLKTTICAVTFQRHGLPLGFIDNKLQPIAWYRAAFQSFTSHAAGIATLINIVLCLFRSDGGPRLTENVNAISCFPIRIQKWHGNLFEKMAFPTSMRSALLAFNTLWSQRSWNLAPGPRMVPGTMWVLVGYYLRVNFELVNWNEAIVQEFAMEPEGHSHKNRTNCS